MDKEIVKNILKENLNVSCKEIWPGGGTPMFFQVLITFDNEEILKIWLKNGYDSSKLYQR